MNTIECIKSRASVRSYKPDEIPDAVLDEVLDAAIHAPSAGNVQDWEFVVVRKQETKARLAEAAYAQGFIAQAPVIVVVCSNLRTISAAYGERGKGLYSIQDTSAASQNLMLAACEKGIGTCWVGSFNDEKVREILVLPTHVRPMALIPMGYPASQPRRTNRRVLGEVVHRDMY
ncbi:MAG: nitroreductase family protein [Candidatus Aenigmarchaeota archaeon]|nr:nitroreductase family protein [Candidatus Aenigmarchaeota archaeon]